MQTLTASARAGETLDALCWRMLGATADVTEQAFALNPGLASAGTKLSAGQQIILPAATPSTPVRETIKLWE